LTDGPQYLRRLPHNVEAEQVVIGTVMLEERLLPEAADLAVDDFAVAEHRAIWAEVLARDATGQNVSPILLRTWAEAEPALERLGGAKYLVAVAGYAVTRLKLAGHAAAVRKDSMCRKLIVIGQDLTDRAYAGNINGALSPIVAELAALVHQGEDGDEAEAALPVRAAPPVLPEAFWAGRPILRLIRSYARAGRCSPDALLLQTMARHVGTWPPGVTIDGGGDPTHAGLFIVTVSPSGAGKTRASRRARRIVPFPADGEPPMDLPIGSGEGLAQAFQGKDPESSAVVQIRHRAHFHIDEAEALIRLLKRESATIGETLRRAFTGEPLGQINVNPRIVRDYRLSLTVNTTPASISDLLKHAGLGLPQRFLWIAASDPGAPQFPPAGVPAPELPIPSEPIIACSTVQQELDAIRLAGLRGTRDCDELDSHLPLIQLRVAGVFCGWDGRTEIIEDDWLTAEVVIRTSCAVRAWAQRMAESERATADAEEAARRGRAAQTAYAMGRQVDDVLARVAKRIGKYVAAADGGAMGRGAACHRLASKERHLFDPAVTLAVAFGWLVEAGDLLKTGRSPLR
jgi:hypothetical protein